MLTWLRFLTGLHIIKALLYNDMYPKDIEWLKKKGFKKGKEVTRYHLWREI